MPEIMNVQIINSCQSESFIKGFVYRDFTAREFTPKDETLSILDGSNVF
jgi:hypothetical protein